MPRSWATPKKCTTTSIFCAQKFKDEAQLNVTPSFNLFSAEASTLVGIIMLLKKVWELIAVLHGIDPHALKRRFSLLHPSKEELVDANRNKNTHRIRHRFETSETAASLRATKTRGGGFAFEQQRLGSVGVFFIADSVATARYSNLTPSFAVTFYWKTRTLGCFRNSTLKNSTSWGGGFLGEISYQFVAEGFSLHPTVVVLNWWDFSLRYQLLWMKKEWMQSILSRNADGAWLVIGILNIYIYIINIDCGISLLKYVFFTEGSPHFQCQNPSIQKIRHTHTKKANCQDTDLTFRPVLTPKYLQVPAEKTSRSVGFVAGGTVIGPVIAIGKPPKKKKKLVPGINHRERERKIYYLSVYVL